MADLNLYFWELDGTDVALEKLKESHSEKNESLVHGEALEYFTERVRIRLLLGPSYMLMSDVL